jgi:threonine/homoserine/homoserine lactone efflux protein
MKRFQNPLLLLSVLFVFMFLVVGEANTTPNSLTSYTHSEWNAFGAGLATGVGICMGLLLFCCCAVVILLAVCKTFYDTGGCNGLLDRIPRLTI